MLLEGGAHRILAEAGIDGGGRLVGMIEDPSDQVQRVSGLGQPAADGTTQVVQANIFHAGCFSHPTPRLADIHQRRRLRRAPAGILLRAWTATGENVGVAVFARNLAQKRQGRGG